MKGELNLIEHFLFKACYTYLLVCRSNGDPGYSQQIDMIQSENSYSLLIVKNFQIVEGGSIARKDILLNELRFHYGVKRRNSSVFTWLCTFWGIKEKKACNVTVRELNEVYTENLLPIHLRKKTWKISKGNALRVSIPHWKFSESFHTWETWWLTNRQGIYLSVISTEYLSKMFLAFKILF